MTKIWPREISRKIRKRKQIEISEFKRGGKISHQTRGGRLGSRPPANQVDWGVDPRVDLGVDLPGRTQAAWCTCFAVWLGFRGL